MNTLFSSVSGNSFRKALASVAFVAAAFFSQNVSAQTILAKNESAMIQPPAAGKFQALVHPIANSVKMKVHFLNPKEDHVTLTIYDQSNTLAYKKIIGRDAIYHGTFDMSKMADGEYHVTVSSRRGTYTRKVVLETQQKRFALAQ